MALAIVLAGECLATNRADEWAFIGMGTKMRAQVIGPGESLGAQRALESRRVFLNPFCRASLLTVLVLRVCQAKRDDIVGNGRGRLSSSRRGCSR